MRSFLTMVVRSPVMLMCVSIVLWMLYPPLVNYLIDRSSTLFVAGISHTLAAIATLAVVVFVFIGDKSTSAANYLFLHSVRAYSSVLTTCYFMLR
ncbi:hypothetical protein EP12_18580 [Alteromonas australica]|nr:hypothetical protein EP12_18580 [Alteromonas australica]